MKNTGTLSVNLPSDRKIALTRVFKALRHLVYDAFSKPEILKRWFGPRGWSLVTCDVDARALARMLSTGGPPMDAIQKTVNSKDGTLIAYEQTGAGPVVILVSAALAAREGARRLARQLASSFTVINYDRRGRGKSSNAEPYAVEREIEDLEALVNAAGQPVFLFGSSSGSVLALDAGSRFGARVKKSDPPRGAGGLMSWAVSKTADPWV